MVKKSSKKRERLLSYHGRYDYADVYLLKTDGMEWKEILEIYPHTSIRILRYPTEKWARANGKRWPIPILNTYYYTLACYGMTYKDIARLAGVHIKTIEDNVKICERKYNRKVRNVRRKRGIKTRRKGC